MKRLSSAIAYAAAGWFVFPLTPGGKTPATSDGFKSATTDPTRIESWWDKNPEFNLGVACGPSNLVVVDVDGDEGRNTLISLIKDGWKFPATLTQTTGSGGAHYVYKTIPGVELRNTAGKLPGVPQGTPHIDLRASGGYIVVPPSRTTGVYEWMPGELEPAECPYWMAQDATPRQSMLTATVEVGNGYGLAALDGECEAVRNSPQGTRNHQLNESAFKIFTLVATGAVDESTAVTRLGYAARAAGLEESEIRNTLRSAAEAGLNNPRKVAV